MDNSKECTLKKAQIETICKCMLKSFAVSMENIFKLYENFVSNEQTSSSSIQINENFKFIFKFVFKSVNVWSKVTTFSNDTDKTNLLDILDAFSQRNDLVTHTFNSNHIDFTLILMNFKLHLCLALSIILDNEIKDNSLRKKLIEYIQNLTDETNPIIQYLLQIGLEGLCSFSHANAKIFGEIMRANTKFKDLIVLRTTENDDFNLMTDANILQERNSSYYTTIKSKEATENNSDRLLNVSSRGLFDDTLNVILMDTSIEVSQHSKEKFGQQTEKKIEQIEKDLDAVIKNYNDEAKPNWIKERLELLFKTCSDRL